MRGCTESRHADACFAVNRGDDADGQSVLSRLLHSAMARRLARGTAWTTAGNVIGRGLTLGGSILIARALGRRDFGAVGFVQGTAIMFQNLAAMGLTFTVSKYLAEHRDRNPERAARILTASRWAGLGTGLASALALLMLAPFMSSAEVGASDLSAVLRISVIAVLFGALTSVATGALAGLEEFKLLATVNVAGGVLSVGTTVLGAKIGSVQGALWGFVMGCGLSWIFSEWAVRSATSRWRFPGRPSGWLQEWREVAAFGAPAALTSVATAVPYWWCNAGLVRQSGGLAEMGSFNAAYQWRTAVFFLPSILSTVMLPLLSNTYATGEKANFRKLLVVALLLNAGATTAGTLGVVLMKGWISELYGSSFEGADLTVPLLLLAASTVPMSIAHAGGQVLSSVGRPWSALAIHVVWGGVLAATWGLSAESSGAVGLSYAHLAACGAQALVGLAFLRGFVWPR